jgi:hypothetical protein
MPGAWTWTEALMFGTSGPWTARSHPTDDPIKSLDDPVEFLHCVSFDPRAGGCLVFGPDRLETSGRQQQAHTADHRNRPRNRPCHCPAPDRLENHSRYAASQ